MVFHLLPRSTTPAQSVFRKYLEEEEEWLTWVQCRYVDANAEDEDDNDRSNDDALEDEFTDGSFDDEN